MEDLFDLLAEGVIEETDNSNLKSIVAEEAIIKIEALSEGRNSRSEGYYGYHGLRKFLRLCIESTYSPHMSTKG